ncbi:hypothetical protein GOP47_0002244, partial [Adiantum capillus-veneris]
VTVSVRQTVVQGVEARMDDEIYLPHHVLEAEVVPRLPNLEALWRAGGTSRAWREVVKNVVLARCPVPRPISRAFEPPDRPFLMCFAEEGGYPLVRARRWLPFGADRPVLPSVSDDIVHEQISKIWRPLPHVFPFTCVADFAPVAARNRILYMTAHQPEHLALWHPLQPTAEWHFPLPGPIGRSRANPAAFVNGKLVLGIPHPTEPTLDALFICDSPQTDGASWRLHSYVLPPLYFMSNSFTELQGVLYCLMAVYPAGWRHHPSAMMGVSVLPTERSAIYPIPPLPPLPLEGNVLPILAACNNTLFYLQHEAAAFRISIYRFDPRHTGDIIGQPPFPAWQLHIRLNMQGPDPDWSFKSGFQVAAIGPFLCFRLSSNDHFIAYDVRTDNGFVGLYQPDVPTFGLLAWDPMNYS